ncbi:Peptidyl-prolyl cis-trans isomerase FKBP8 [Oopsacas minuta]|uniref:peptidylprolyl isomerase n=1 Tax=Oopsacas minuta TaxID=111878 RepID=A0AAV7K0M1_9METZ|nr:Peptidyl-prolyl cis-trans isomerase FKBP8 [Oopsacas minuta]
MTANIDSIPESTNPAVTLPPNQPSDQSIANPNELQEASINPITDSHTPTQPTGTPTSRPTDDIPTSEPHTSVTESTKDEVMVSMPRDDLLNVDFANSNVSTPVVNLDPPLDVSENAEHPLDDSTVLEETKSNTTPMIVSSDSFVMVPGYGADPPQTILESQILEELEPKSKPVIAEEDWLDILGNGSLKKLIIEKGGSAQPTRGQRVLLDFAGHLSQMDGVVVEEQTDFEAELGESEIVQGLDLAIPLMMKGEVAWIFVTSRFGYGDTGNGRNIPANTDLYYMVKLKEIYPRYDFPNLTEDKLMELVERKKSRGNNLYKLNQLALAITSYSNAIKILKSHQYITTPEGKTIGCRILTNLAIAQYKHELANESLVSCDDALRLIPQDTKALYRKATILTERQEYEDAIHCLEQALASSPDDNIVEQELKRVRLLNYQSNRRQRDVYRRMIQGSTPNREIPVEEKEGNKGKLAVLVASSVVAVAAICLGLLLYKKS